VVIGGDPMVLVGDGPGDAGLFVESLFCNPVRTADAALVASCHVPGGNYFNQLWLVPFDGSAPQQITQVVDEGSGVDFGAGDLWTTTDGRQFVQRYGDCGAAWVEELQADGTTIESAGAGVIPGVDGTRLITAATAPATATTRRSPYDPATGVTTTYHAPPDCGDHPCG
jgi:hypothetical protein